MNLKQILFVGVALIFSAGAVNACPVAAYDPDSKLNWLVGGEFRGQEYRMSGGGVHSLGITTGLMSHFHRRQSESLGNWLIHGVQHDKPVFSFEGEGLKSFNEARREARSILVPKRRGKVKYDKD